MTNEQNTPKELKACRQSLKSYRDAWDKQRKEIGDLQEDANNDRLAIRVLSIALIAAVAMIIVLVVQL
jgi:type IV secretory pathway component VirB8